MRFHVAVMVGLAASLACSGAPLPAAPPSASCTADSECTGSGLGPHPASDDPCCTGYPGEVVSVAYEAWRVDWRRTNCTGREECPALPPPAPPPPGFFDTRCDAGTCVRAMAPLPAKP